MIVLVTKVFNNDPWDYISSWMEVVFKLCDWNISAKINYATATLECLCPVDFNNLLTINCIKI